MSPFRYRDDESSAGTIVGVLVGALAGFAAGMFVAQRVGGFGGLTSRLRERAGGRFGIGRGEDQDLQDEELEDYEEDRRPQPVGLVGIVGTVREHRRRGLAAGLTAEALRRLRAAGARSSSLYVDAQNPTRAYDVYRKLGYEVGFEDEVWELTFN